MKFKEEKNILGAIIVICIAAGILGGLIFDKLADGIILGAIVAVVVGVIYEVTILARQNSE